MKKVIILLLSIFLLTGCNITYELEMDKNGGIIDKLTIIEKYDTYNNNLISDYNDFIKDRNSIINIENEIEEDKKSYNSVFKKEYKNINEYKNDYYINKYVGNVNYSCDKTCKIDIAFNDNIKNVFKENNDIKKTYMDNKDEITIKIYTPYKIINTNAEIDKDTLIFKIAKDNIPSNIYFEYKDLTINDSNKKIYYVLAIGAIALIVMILFFSQIKKQKKSDL